MQYQSDEIESSKIPRPQSQNQAKKKTSKNGRPKMEPLLLRQVQLIISIQAKNSCKIPTVLNPVKDFPMARDQTGRAELVPESAAGVEVHPCPAGPLSLEVEMTLSTPVLLSLALERGIHISKLVSILRKGNLNMS